MIKTIIFDIGGVISGTDFVMVQTSFAQRVGLSPDVVIAYHKNKEVFNEYLLGTRTLDDFIADMSKAGADSSADILKIWIEEYIHHRKINHELLSIIKQLRENYSVGVLTNCTRARAVVDEKMGLYSHFDYALLSCEERLKKPDPAFYKLALTKADVEPNEALFIDDKERCTLGAEAVGITGILYIYPDNAKLVESLRQFGVVI